MINISERGEAATMGPGSCGRNNHSPKRATWETNAEEAACKRQEQREKIKCFTNSNSILLKPSQDHIKKGFKMPYMEGNKSKKEQVGLYQAEKLLYSKGHHQ